MLVFCFVLICFSQSLFAVELSIYKSFTEVREPHSGIGDFTYKFTNKEYENIIDGSINWDGTPFVRQEVYNTIESLQDAKVIVRQSSVCGCEKIEAKIVDPNSMLLQNLNTGAYFYSDKQSIEYTSTRPNDDRTTLLFQFPTTTTKHNGTLSYLMTGITWKPSYDLFLIGNNDYKLLAYANINNDQQREYTVEKTYLLGGDVQLATSYSKPVGRLELVNKAISMKPIRSEGEQKGLYSYSLNDKYTLRSSSTIRLPFIDISAKYRFYYKVLTNIGTKQSQGVFEKTYDITPDHFMPAGIINIRDSQVLVGQSNLPDVPENYTQTITVGQDNDVRYLVKSNLTSKINDSASVTFETYELDIHIMNYKRKNVDIQLLFSEGIQMILHNTTCKSAKVNGNQLDLSTSLEQGENRLCKFNVTVKLT